MAEELTSVISTEVERRVAEAIRALRSEMTQAIAPRSSGRVQVRTQPDQRRGGRLCPVPGCGKPGAGPRNRWFCKEHAKSLSPSEMKGIVERAKRLEGEGKLPTKVAADRVVRLPPKAAKARRTLDMTCRVEGCTNRSRGPRSGFICDMHRAQLTPEEQLAAREQYKERMKGKVEEAPRPSQPPAPVPPSRRRKAETADGAEPAGTEAEGAGAEAAEAEKV